MKLLILAALIACTQAWAQALPKIALVYGGDGACPEDCVAGAVKAAELAGLTALVVDPKKYDPKIFDSAAVWIQPGGVAVTASLAMGSKLKTLLRNFVKNGGGYVGFCAGAFLATSRIGTSGYSGLGITVGNTILYEGNDTYPSIEKMNFFLDSGNQTRDIYWEGGPRFTFSNTDFKKIEVKARYAKTNQISTIRTTYGKGRVFVTGAHPEAPEWWRTSERVIDEDGLDYGVTTEMLQWVTGAR